MNTLLRIKKLRESQKRVPFFSSIDLLTVDDDGLMAGVSGRLGYGYQITGVDYQLRNRDGITGFLHDTEKLLKQIPDGIVLSFLKKSEPGDRELIKKHVGLVSQKDTVSRLILEAKLKSLKKQRLLKKSLFLFVSFLEIEPQKGLFKKAPDMHSDQHENRVKILRQTESLLFTGFGALGIKIQKLSKPETLGEYYRRFNPSLSELVPYAWAFPEDPISHPRFETLRSRLLLHPPKLTEESFYLDGYYHAICNLRTLPEEASIGMVKSFEKNLPEDSEWLITLRKKEREASAQKMRVKANMSKANVFFRISEDHFASERVRQHETFLKEMAETSSELFEISFSVLVKARTEKELDSKKETVLKNFPRFGGAVGVLNHFEHDRLFVSHLPLQGDENALKFPILSRALVRLLPLGEEWKGTERPELLLKTYQDEGLSLDLFDPALPAKHALMIGSTGSGKSFTTNHLLSHFISAGEDHHVVVIDVGGSYRKLTRIFGGSYFEVQCSEEFAMNPFPLKAKIFPKDREYDSDQLSFLTTLLEKMVTQNEKISSREQRILESSVIETYHHLEDQEAPLLENVRACLKDYPLGDDEDKKRAYEFSKELGVWTEGRFGRILNRPGKLQFDDRLLVFDLARLSVYPELQSILFFVIHSALNRKIRNLALKKMIVIDEGWRFFNDEVGSRLIEDLYRTARKNNGLILSISQCPEDFLTSKASTAILANSYVKYILKLQKGHDLLAKFDLNENEVAATRELEVNPGKFSEVFIKFFEKSVIAKLEPSPLDYWIATTDPDDFLEEEKFKSAHAGISDIEVLENLAREFPYGVRRAPHGE